MTESELDNTLVHQKDAIRKKILSGQISAALDTLEGLYELWCKATYHYKGRECCQLAESELQTAKDTTKNWRRKRLLEGLIERARLLGQRYFNAEHEWKTGTPAGAVC